MTTVMSAGRDRKFLFAQIAVLCLRGWMSICYYWPGVLTIIERKACKTLFRGVSDWYIIVQEIWWLVAIELKGQNNVPARLLPGSVYPNNNGLTAVLGSRLGFSCCALSSVFISSLHQWCGRMTKGRRHKWEIPEVSIFVTISNLHTAPSSTAISKTRSNVRHTSSHKPAFGLGHKGGFEKTDHRRPANLASEQRHAQTRDLD